MNIRTPISLLQELCVSHNVLFPKYELIQSGVNEAKTFEYIVDAFDLCANGVGTAKQQAKQEAAMNLLTRLKKLEKFKELILPEFSHPTCVQSSDPVSCLLELCTKYSKPTPIFEVIEMKGESHKPEFTMACHLLGHTTTGKSKTKKAAKKIVAQEMLAIMEKKFAEEAAISPIPIHEIETCDVIIKRYRTIKKERKKPVTGRIADRHRYFENLPKPYRDEAVQFLIANNQNTSRENVHMVCQALKLRYEISNLRDRYARIVCNDLIVFELVGDIDFDCVIIDKEPDIWDNVITYFQNMLNLVEY